MGEHGGGSGLARQGLPVKVVFENRFDTLVRTRADAESPPAGGFEAIIAIAFAQPHDAQTRAEALLGMRTRGENGFDDWGCGLSGFRRPEHEPLWGPCGIVPVRLGHVGRDCAVVALVLGALVAGHPVALVEDFDDLRTETPLERLFDQAVWHGGIVPDLANHYNILVPYVNDYF